MLALASRARRCRRNRPHRRRPRRSRRSPRGRASCRSPRSKPGCAIPTRSMHGACSSCEPLDPLDAEIGPLERGSAVHEALETFVERLPGALPRGRRARPDRNRRRQSSPNYGDAQGRAGAVATALRCAPHWFVGIERERRAGDRALHLEISGSASSRAAARLHAARHRRPHRYADDGGAAILDYKTGSAAAPTAGQGLPRAAAAARSRDPRAAASRISAR